MSSGESSTGCPFQRTRSNVRADDEECFGLRPAKFRLHAEPVAVVAADDARRERLVEPRERLGEIDRLVAHSAVSICAFCSLPE